MTSSYSSFHWKLHRSRLGASVVSVAVMDRAYADIRPGQAERSHVTRMPGAADLTDRSRMGVKWEHGPDLSARSRGLPPRDPPVAHRAPARGVVRARLRDGRRGQGPVPEGLDPRAVRGRLDLRHLARPSTAARACPPWRRWCSTRSSPGPARRCGPTSSATPWWARPSCSGAPRSRRSSSCPRSSRVRSPGARASASPTPARTWPGCRPRPCSTVTSGSSTARRSGPPRASSPTTSSCCAAPIPRRPSTPASPTCCAPWTSRASRCDPSSRSTAPPSSPRSSSPTPAARRTTWWAGSTTGGRWP